jgi:mono/diheme cytochrome c family protein
MSPRRLERLVLAVFLLAAAGAAAIGYAAVQAHKTQARAAQLTGGDPARAPALMNRYGCAGCHTIAGLQAPGGLVGPPLRDLGRRVYVAGVLTNTPDNLVRWIVNPKEFNPRTAMPVTGVSEEEARDIAAYLYAR